MALLKFELVKINHGLIYQTTEFDPSKWGKNTEISIRTKDITGKIDKNLLFIKGEFTTISYIEDESDSISRFYLGYPRDPNAHQGGVKLFPFKNNLERDVCYLQLLNCFKALANHRGGNLLCFGNEFSIG
jgi:hypothetical protein